MRGNPAHTLRLLLKMIDNQNCADCKVEFRDTIWASVTTGSFLCLQCAGAHRKLGVHISRVKSIDMDNWTEKEVEAMEKGNNNVNKILESHVEEWKVKLCTSSETEFREEWIRLKYRDKLFTMPKKDVYEEDTSENEEKSNDAVTTRFVDYFVVIGGGKLARGQNVDASKSPFDLNILPTVLDQYPPNYKDSPLPVHISQFAFPEGYALSATTTEPAFSSFVLTNVAGTKLYAASLKIYEEVDPLEMLQYFTPSEQSAASSLVKIAIPSWVQDTSTGSVCSSVYSPKCLLLLSHYPFYSAYRQFLQQLYRVSLSQSPIPMERYITNFTTEIPLPPRGRVQVQCTLPGKTLTISRPPTNELPLIDHPFRPLFQLLDMDNIILVFSCLLREQKVVLCSKRVGTLTPVSETLLALLFPLTWQGAYIPVLPNNLLDVLDAPVPFLVGIHSQYLANPKMRRPEEVVFVDLDHNRIFPALDANGTELPLPKIPERSLSKLKTKLNEFSDIFCPFATQVNKIDLAFQEKEHLQPMGNLDGSVTISNEDVVHKAKRFVSRLRKGSLSSIRSQSVDLSSGVYDFKKATFKNEEEAPYLLVDSKYNESGTFSTHEIRQAFLRFMVSLLKKYPTFIYIEEENEVTHQRGGPRFDELAFLKDFNDISAKDFMTELISSQMFQRICEDRHYHPELPELLFFDESILEKTNRGSLLGKKKKESEFFSDTSDAIRETYIVPPPSTLGIMDNGTIFQYKRFPRLKQPLFGHIRAPPALVKTPEAQRHAKHVSFHQQLYMLSRRAAGTSTHWQHAFQRITIVQKQYRMHHARKEYRNMRRNVLFIQDWFRFTIKRVGRRRRRHKKLRCAFRIQKWWRGIQTRKRKNKMFIAAGLIQQRLLVYAAQMKFRRIRTGLLQYQALFRSHRRRKRSAQRLLGIVKAQAFVRGRQTRILISVERGLQLSALRHEIHQLWKECYTPLLFRSKFWSLYSSNSYFSVSAHLEERKRLYECKKHFDLPTSTKPSLPMKGLKDRMNKMSLSRLKGQKLPIHLHSALSHAKCREDDERKRLYEYLKYYVPAEQLQKYYSCFDIKKDGKRKKQTLSKLVWQSLENAEMSVQILMGKRKHSRTLFMSAEIESIGGSRLRQDLVSTVRASLSNLQNNPKPTSHSRLLKTNLELRSKLSVLQAQLDRRVETEDKQ